MRNISFSKEFEGFYDKCLTDLKARPNWSEAFVPQLERFVTITAKLSELNAALVEEEVTIEHTNKAGHTNKATSPVWRMFLALNDEANKLAAQLKLSPATAPAIENKSKKGFNLEGKMKVA